MERRKFTREFKLEAVQLIQARGVTVAQAARDLGVHGTVLRRWVQGMYRRFAAGLSRPGGRGRMPPILSTTAPLKRGSRRVRKRHSSWYNHGGGAGHRCDKVGADVALAQSLLIKSCHDLVSKNTLSTARNHPSLQGKGGGMGPFCLNVWHECQA